MTTGWLGAFGDLEFELMIDMGAHTVSGLAETFLARPTANPSVTMPFFGVQTGVNSRWSWGGIAFTLLVAHDIEKNEVTAAWSNTVFEGNDSTEYEVGGLFVGAGFGVLFGAKPSR